MAIKHCRHFLERRHFHILTDHKPLTCLSTASNSSHTTHEIHELAYISEFTSNIQHISGTENPVADALSQIEINATVDERPPVDFAAMATAQYQDSELQVLRLDENSLKYKDVQLPGCTIPLICDTSTGCPCPYVPAPFRHSVFRRLALLVALWHTCDSTPCHSAISMATKEHRHPPLDTCLPQVLENQSPAQHSEPTGYLSASRLVVQSRAPGPHRPFATIKKQPVYVNVRCNFF